MSAPQLVSAVITTHNRPELLKRAVESVLQQTYPNIELIVVDDKSVPGTNDFCKAMPLTYIYIPAAESKGGNHARNVGINHAQGEYIAFLDDDDCWMPSKIEKQVELMERMNCPLVYCGMKKEIVSKKGISYKDRLPNPQYFGDMSRKILTTISCCLSSTMLIKKSILVEAGMFDETLDFWQDYELSIRIAQMGEFHFVNEPLILYRINKKDKARLTNKYFRWLEAVRYIRKKHRKLFEKLSNREKITVRFQFCYDAADRCGAEGLVLRKWRYKIEVIFLKVLLRLYPR
ncbi:MAG: glycosyltransferase family 2 protein, partial [Bacteroidales bacterium]|nr:glycosyltransferase family 2 protein [Bacteroidales bacterium]